MLAISSVCVGALILYAWLYPPPQAVNTLPEGESFIVFTGIRQVPPLRREAGLFVINPNNGVVHEWVLLDEIEFVDYITWVLNLQALSAIGRDVSGIRSIYLLQANGSSFRQAAIKPLGTFVAHSWSPDGTKIAISLNEDPRRDRYDIYVQSIDGSGFHRVTDASIGGISPSWSPDGSEIVFESFNFEDSASSLYKVDVDGTGLELLTVGVGGSNRGPQWSPGGDRIAFLHSAGRADQAHALWVMNQDGSNPHSIFEEMNSQSDSQAAGITIFSWSPDGQQLVFSSGHEGPCHTGRTGSAEYAGCGERIYVIGYNGKGLKRLTDQPQPQHFAFAWVN